MNSENIIEILLQELISHIAEIWWQLRLHTEARGGEILLDKLEDIHWQWNDITIRDKVEGLRFIQFTHLICKAGWCNFNKEVTRQAFASDVKAHWGLWCEIQTLQLRLIKTTNQNCQPMKQLTAQIGTIKRFIFGRAMNTTLFKIITLWSSQTSLSRVWLLKVNTSKLSRTKRALKQRKEFGVNRKIHQNQQLFAIQVS